MKKLLALPAAALFLALSASLASAQVLLTDNYTVDQNQSDANFEISNGRQGGTLATTTYTPRPSNQAPSYGVQVGNGGVGNGNSLTLAFGNAVYLNHDFKDINAPISISFRGDVTSLNGAGSSSWLSFNLLTSPTTQDNFPTVVPFGLLFHANGQTEYFQNGNDTQGNSGANVGNDVYQNYRVVISDFAGTGSGFAGNGTEIKYFSGGVLLNTVDLGTSLLDGYIGLNGIDIAAIDDLSISAVTAGVPEPTTEVQIALAAGVVGLAVWARRRRLLHSAS